MTHGSLEPMLVIEALTHLYGRHAALDDVSLTAAKGEFLTILGESGSGKTTLLRVISGLEQPTSVGQLRIGGADVAGLPPAKRNCTTVFQNYALFPHLSVVENVMYGLSIRGMPHEDARRDALKALATVRLQGLEERRISQLSGGQKQRVAIARCIVTRPAVMLLDEPLGALDERLRVDMQNELVDLQRQLGMTFVYITHSQEEALAMSDRIVLMRLGRIEQRGAPSDLFDRPASAFAARFMGYENFLDGTALKADGQTVTVRLQGGSEVRGLGAAGRSPVRGASVKVALRAERVSAALAAPATGPLNVIPARPVDRRYRGKYSDVSVETEAGVVKLRSWSREEVPAELTAITWRPDDCVVLDASA